jgi:NAD(P)H dehydrogenase (quinone)
MTTFAVTGATGPLGRLAVEELLARGVPASDVVAIVRNPEKAADLAARGVVIRTADYSQPETLPAALEGVTVLLLVSGNEVGRRVAQHGAVIEAAKAAGVDRIAYTSITRADTTQSPLAPEHKATEELLRNSGVPFTILRNNWYHENYTGQLGQYLERGEVVAIDGNARIAAAARADFAAAAAATLVGEGHDNAVYELTGPGITLAELAETISDVTGTKVAYRDATAAELAAGMQAAGLDEGLAGFLVALEESTARGDLDHTSDDLTRLIGRPAGSLADAVRAAQA